MLKRRIAPLALFIALVSAACGGSSNDSSSDTTAASGASGSSGSTVVLKDLKFSPDDITVETGDTVKWEWKENVLHNVTAKDGSFKSDNKSDGTFTHTFDKAGTYEYECTLHTGMAGKVTVS